MDIIGLQSCATYDEAEFMVKLAKVQDQCGKVSNAAYNVGSFASYSAVQSGAGCKPARASRMFAEVAKMNLEHLMQELIQAGNSERTFDTLVNIAGIGNFIGYQICIDLGYYSRRLHGAPLPTSPLVTNLGWVVQRGCASIARSWCDSYA
jgi:hypothetical protein